MGKRHNLVAWIKKNKTKLIIGITAVGTIGAAVFMAKNRTPIDGFLKKKSEIILPELPVIDQNVSNFHIPIITNEIVNNLTGNKHTARDLGNIALCSAQKINKRIVDAGLAVKYPNGEYVMTESGKLLGETTVKTNAAGHTFSNIEWDERILELIFSREELQAIEDFKEKARQIFSA